MRGRYIIGSSNLQQRRRKVKGTASWQEEVEKGPTLHIKQKVKKGGRYNKLSGGGTSK